MMVKNAVVGLGLWVTTCLAIPIFIGCGSRGMHVASADAGVDVTLTIDQAPDGGKAIGGLCSLSANAGVPQAMYNASASECPSHLCLKPMVQGGASGTVNTGSTCSAECTQDSDCDGELRDLNNPLDKRCMKGFACAIPFVVGSLCCKKLCVCKDFLGVAGTTSPIACDEAHNNGADCAGAISSIPASGAKGVEQETDLYFSLQPARKIDLVTMVDNTPSMAPKVSKLNAQFPKMIEALKDPDDGTLPDLRVAIINSDMGTGHAHDRGSCGPHIVSDGSLSAYGDLGRFQMLSSPTACTFNTGAQFLEYKSGAAVNFTGDISTVFSCLTSNLGTLGCGYEHQLQAFEFALVAKGIGNDEQQKMLRADAYLILMFLSDEDDCSAATNNGMFGDKSELRTESMSLRCATRAHRCGGTNLTSSPPGYPTNAAFTRTFADCQARMDSCPNQTDGTGSATDTSVPTDCSPLKSVMFIADEMKSLKSNWESQLLVAGIFGWPLNDADLASAQYKIAPVPNPDTTDAIHPTIYDYWPVCYDPNHMPSASTTDPATGFDATAAAWGATGGLRESAFINEFGENGLKFSICEPDFAQPMQLIGSAINQKQHNLCFAYKLVDTDSAIAGVQANCRVVYRTPGPDPADPTRIIYFESATSLPQCLPGASKDNTPTSCWQLVDDKRKCPSGQLVNVIRSAEDISQKPQLESGTKLSMQCQTCPDPLSGSSVIPGCDY